MNVRRLAISSGVLIAFIVLTAASCGGGSGSPPAHAVRPVDVRVVVAAVRPLARTFEAGGVVNARMTAHLSPRIAAELREVRVQPGDRARKGQTLALLDDRDLAAERARAEAAASAAVSGAATAAAERESADAKLALARATHRRIEGLRERNSATPQELDRATADLHTAEASVRAAAARAAEASASAGAAQAAARAAAVASSFSVVTAPFDGLVTNRLLEPGNMASPGIPVLTIESADGFRLEVQVDAARAQSIDVGDTAAVILDGTEEGDTVPARVVEVARAIDPAAHAFIVKVELPAGAAVRSGMFARARFESATGEALSLPASAVMRRGQLALAFVVDGNKRARMRSIRVGEQRGEWVEVLAGIRAGETIIVNPPDFLVDGADVRTAGVQP